MNKIIRLSFEDFDDSFNIKSFQESATIPISEIEDVEQYAENNPNTVWSIIDYEEEDTCPETDEDFEEESDEEYEEVEASDEDDSSVCAYAIVNGMDGIDPKCFIITEEPYEDDVDYIIPLKDDDSIFLPW